MVADEADDSKMKSLDDLIVLISGLIVLLMGAKIGPFSDDKLGKYMNFPKARRLMIIGGTMIVIGFLLKIIAGLLFK